MRHDVEKQKPAGAVAYWRSVRRITYVAGSLALGGFAVDKAPDLLEYMSGMSVLFYAGPLAEVTITGNIQGPTAPGASPYANEPTDMTLIYSAKGDRGNDQLSQGFSPNDDGVCSPNGCWDARTDTVTLGAYNAPSAEGDSILFRHNHPGNGIGSNSNFAGNIIVAEWDDLTTFSGAQDFDTVYIYLSTHENGKITAEHGRKLFFIGVERGAFADSLIGGADIFPTWESSNVFTFQYQAGLFDDDYTSGGGSAGNWSSTTPGAGLDSVWTVHEFVIKANTEGSKDGAVTWWVNGDTVFHSDTMRFEQSGSAGCTNGKCGISGFTWFMNTDAATSNQHYSYTGELYISGKGSN